MMSRWPASSSDVAILLLHSKHPVLKKRHRFVHFYATETKRRGQTRQFHLTRQYDGFKVRTITNNITAIITQIQAEKYF